MTMAPGQPGVSRGSGPKPGAIMATRSIPMSVFATNARRPLSVLPEHVVRARRSAQAAIHRDRLARQRSAETLARQAAFREAQAAAIEAESIPAMLAMLEQPNGSPTGPANAYDRVMIENRIVSATRK